MADEVKDFLQKGVIKKSQAEEGELISPISLVPKSEDSFGLILNLKRLNENMSYIHFKMEAIRSILTLLIPHCYMAKVDRYKGYILFCPYPTRTSKVSKILLYRKHLSSHIPSKWSLLRSTQNYKINKTLSLLSKITASYCSRVYWWFNYIGQRF